MTWPKTRVSLKAVAAEAKVSVAAASMALANSPRISLAVRRRVWAISRQLGYEPVKRSTPARYDFQASRVGRIGFVALGDSLRRPGTGLVVMQLIAVTSQLGMRLESMSCEDVSDPARATERVVDFGDALSGLIVIGMSVPAVFDGLAAAHIPFVVVGSCSLDTPVNVVNFDHVGAGRTATAYLIAKGHRRIGFVCDRISLRSHNAMWQDGYRLAHSDAGLQVDPGLSRVTGVLDGGLERAGTDFLTGPDAPDAYIVPNLYLTETLITSLHTLGRDAPVCGVRFQETTGGRSGNFPCVVYSVQAWVEHAIVRLTSLCQKPGQPPHQIIVPFETRNMT